MIEDKLTKEKAKEYKEIFDEWWGIQDKWYQSKRSFNKYIDERTEENSKPCPFCGSKPERHKSGKYIYCNNEECAIYNSATTLEKWNTREYE